MTDATEETNLHPSELLLHLIITLLAPMFLGVAGGNIDFARMAAYETVNAYRARNHVDLIAVAQIVAFGLAALGSLSLSMADDLTLNMTLRLRGNANACSRSAEQNRKALARSQAEPELELEPEDPPTYAEPEPAPFLTPEAERLLAAESQARLEPAAATPRTTEPQRNRDIWADSMAKQASAITASLPSLPPAEQREAELRAEALGTTARGLSQGATVQPRSPEASPPPG